MPLVTEQAELNRIVMTAKRLRLGATAKSSIPAGHGSVKGCGVAVSGSPSDSNNTPPKHYQTAGGAIGTHGPWQHCGMGVRASHVYPYSEPDLSDCSQSVNAMMQVTVTEALGLH